MADDLDLVRQCEDAGASAFVLHSLFEEQITGARYADLYRMELYPGSAEATQALFPQARDYALTPLAISGAGSGHQECGQRSGDRFA